MNGEDASNTRATVACIIPFYNEQKRILSVLQAVQAVDTIDEIIAVDDGSTDNGRQLVLQHYPLVTVVCFTKNRGKAAAVKAGLKATKARYILLLDGDLANLKPIEIDRGIATITQLPQTDMIIFKRINELLVFKSFRSHIVLSGNRILKREHLAAVLTNGPKRYELEVAINHYMIKHQKKVYWVPDSSINFPQIKKVGFLKGMKVGTVMLYSASRYIGFGNFTRQIVSFCTQGFE